MPTAQTSRRATRSSTIRSNRYSMPQLDLPVLRGPVAGARTAVEGGARITIGCARLSVKSRPALQHRTGSQHDVISRCACNERTKMQ
jgi:hypothetical protein